jgi:hypothetical protein
MAIDSQYVTYGIGLIVLFMSWCLQIRPAVMKFFDKTIPVFTKDGKDWIGVTSKRNEVVLIYIGMRLHWPRKFKVIDVRFVEKRPLLKWFWLANDVPENSTQVVSIEDQHCSILNDTEYAFIRHDNNKSGGIEAVYKEPIDMPFWGWMWYAVKIRSDRDWNGYLSFQIRRGNLFQGIIRKPLFQNYAIVIWSSLVFVSSGVSASNSPES